MRIAAPEPLTALQRATTIAGATWKGLIVLALGFAAARIRDESAQTPVGG